MLAAVANEEEAPSVLLTLADEHTVARSSDAVPNALRPLVGALRRIAVTGAPPQRQEAAAALARLAREGVPGAAPEHWHGLAAPSTDAPLEPDPTAPVRVSPSKLEQFERSPLDWFVDRVAGGEPLLAGAIGTMLHRILEEGGDADEAALLAALEGRWRELDFEADWIGAKERRLAERMIRAIARYLDDRRADGTRLVGGETPFAFEHGRAQVRGTIDRVELDRQGRLRVVDLKTGSTKVTKADAVTHAQLGVYQLAVLEGVVPDVEPGPRGRAPACCTSARRRSAATRSSSSPRSPRRRPRRCAQRLATSAEGMAAARFEGLVEPEVRHGGSSFRAMLARIQEVCGD